MRSMSLGFFRVISGCVTFAAILCCALIIETTEPGVLENAFELIGQSTNLHSPLVLDGSVR